MPSVDIIPVKKRMFPPGPVMLASAHYEPGKIVVRPGEILFWKLESGTSFYLKNAHWIRRVTFEVVPVNESPD